MGGGLDFPFTEFDESFRYTRISSPVNGGQGYRRPRGPGLEAIYLKEFGEFSMSLKKLTIALAVGLALLAAPVMNVSAATAKPQTSAAHVAKKSVKAKPGAKVTKSTKKTTTVKSAKKAPAAKTAAKKTVAKTTTVTRHHPNA